MKFCVSLFLLVFASTACKRIVDIEKPYPVKAKYCHVNDNLLGHWQSDSVWVLTHVDSLDSTIINKRPTYYYDLLMACDNDTTLLLNYINYSGVVTREVYSQNFETTDSSILVFDEFETKPIPENATLNLKTQIFSDTTFSTSFQQKLNKDQQTTTQVWFKKV